MQSEKKIIEERNDKIKEALWRTLSFFDIFDYPLTGFETWAYSQEKCAPEEVQAALDAGVARAQLETLNGFYFLIGRARLVSERQKRFNYTDRKMKRVARVCRIFKYIPWIRLVAIGNIIGANNLRDESDIDLFIVSSPDRLWLTRFFCAGLMKILGLRPAPGKERDKICLSFFISERALDLKPLMLSHADLYFVYWLAGLMPIYDKYDTYKKLIGLNAWLWDYLPNWQTASVSSRYTVGDDTCRLWRKFFDFVFGRWEKAIKKFQEKIMPPQISGQKNQDTRVVATNDIIKLHTNDRRADFMSKLDTQLSGKNDYEIRDLKKLLQDFQANLPHFSDGRIDYTTAAEAPVINCFVKAVDKILILKRSHEVSSYQGKWMVVGGYIDDFKPLRLKAIEELEEELGFNRKIIKSFRFGRPYKFFDVNLKKTWIIYPVLAILSAQPEIKINWEHTEYKWIKQSEIKDHDIVPDLEMSLRKVSDDYEVE